MSDPKNWFASEQRESLQVEISRLKSELAAMENRANHSEQLRISDKSRLSHELAEAQQARETAEHSLTDVAGLWSKRLQIAEEERDTANELLRELYGLVKHLQPLLLTTNHDERIAAYLNQNENPHTNPQIKVTEYPSVEAALAGKPAHLIIEASRDRLETIKTWAKELEGVKVRME